MIVVVEHGIGNLGSITNMLSKLGAVAEISPGQLTIMVNAAGRDGGSSSCDPDLVRGIASTASVPVIAAGAASSPGDFKTAMTDAGATAVGALFALQGKHRAVLITHPSGTERIGV